MKRKGLTLIELIVVIGLILFIATAFIFPAFERARGRAGEVVCISNLHQIGQALLMYAQDHDGLVPPYCNLDENLEISPLKARKWRTAFDPYVRDNGIFFCLKDPFAGLPPEKTPCQGAPVRDPSECNYAGQLDHSVTSYFVCPEVMVNGEVLCLEDWFARGYYPTTDPYQNMDNFPPQWLATVENWRQATTRLHSVAVYLEDYTHYLPEALDTRQVIELFFDGHVETHPCSIWKELSEYFKKRYAKEGDRK